MEEIYHQIIPLIVLEQMPDLQKLFKAQKYSKNKIMADAIRPDQVYKDSMAQTSEVHHAHSYKQHIVDGRLCWRDGDCLERVKALAIDIHNYRTNNEWKNVCRFLCEWSHYAVDSHTYPHLVRGKPWSDFHISWELHQAKWIERNKHRIGQLEFAVCPDIYRAFVKDAREMYYDALNVVERLVKGEQMTDEENLALVRRIATVVGSGWLSITHKFWPTE